jgi:hypothetical protein
MKKGLALAAALALVTTALTALTAGSIAHAAPPGEMACGTTLAPGQSLSSEDGTYSLVMTGTGDLVLQGTVWPATAPSVLWSSGTSGRPTNSTYLSLECNGNMVLHNYVYPAPAATAIWASNTAGSPNPTLRLGNDGNLSLSSSRVLWATNTIPKLTTFSNAMGGLVLDADSNSMNREGTTVQMWQASGAANQEWKLYPTNTGSFLIRNKVSWRCLTTDGSTTANGAGVGLYGCHGGLNQQWSLVGNQLVSAFSNKCLDVGANQNGALARIWDCNGAAGQQWTRSTAASTGGTASSIASRIVQIARDELAKKPAESNGNNVVRYYDGRGALAPYNKNRSWCADFASWVVITAGSSMPWMSHCGNGRAGTMERWARDNNKFRDITAGAKPGDLMLINRPGSCTHVTIVVEVRADGAVRTIGGNEGDRVSFTDWHQPSSRGAYGFISL